MHSNESVGSGSRQTAVVKTVKAGKAKTCNEGLAMLMGHRSLKVYQVAFRAAMDVYRATKLFPREEFSLIDQLRRSSRGVAANVAEGYRKRQYPKMFAQSLSVADGELSETLVWLEFAVECGHLMREQFDQLLSAYEEVGRMLGGMIAHPEKFAPRGRSAPASTD